MRSRKDAVISLAIFLLPWIFFLPGSIGYLGIGDTFLYEHPIREFMARTLLTQGRIPLISPYILSGFPIIGDPMDSPFFPLSWLHIFLEPVWAMNIELLCIYGLASAGTYLFTRSLGLSRLSGIFSAICFTYGGFMLGWHFARGIIAPLSIFPFVLIAVQKLKESFSFKWLAMGGLMVGVQYFSGHPQLTLYSSLFCFLFALWPSQANSRLVSRLISVISIYILGVGISAVGILPAYWSGSQSARAGLSYEEFSTSSAHFFDIIGSLALWGPIESREVSFHAGIAALALCVLALWRTKRGKKHVSGLTGFFAFAALLYALFALGENTPLHRVLHHVPFWNLFSAPKRHAAFVTFALSILAAFGLDRLLRNEKLKLTSNLATTITIVLVAVTLVSSRIAAGKWYGGLNSNSRDNFSQRPVLGELYHSLPDGPWRVFTLVNSGNHVIEFLPDIGAPNLNMRHEMESAAGYQNLMPARYKEFLGDLSTSSVPDKVFSTFTPGGKLFDVLNVRLFALPEEYLEAGSIKLYGPKVPFSWKGIKFAEPLGLRVGPMETKKIYISPTEADGIALITSIRTDKEVPPGSIVAEVNILSETGGFATVPLVAGVYTADSRLTASRFSNPEKIRQISIQEPVEISPDHPLERVFEEPFKASKVQLITHLANAAELKQGEAAAQLILSSPDGKEVTIQLKAGIDTAEWRVADKSINASHRLPESSIPIKGATGIQGHKFETVLHLDGTLVSSLKIKPLGKDSIMNVSHLSFLTEGATPEIVLVPLGKRQAAYEAFDFSRSREFPPVGYFSEFQFRGVFKTKIIEVKNLLEDGELFIDYIALKNGEKIIIPSRLAAFLYDEEHFGLVQKSNGIMVFENKKAFPRIWLVNKVEKLAPSSIRDGLAGILPEKELHPANVAYVEEIDNELADMPGKTDPNTKLEVKSIEAEEIVFEVESKDKTMAVLSVPYSDGWKAYIDDARTKIYRVDYVLMGVPVKPGKHKIVFKFELAAFELGKKISALSLLIVGVLFGISVFKKKTAHED